MLGCSGDCYRLLDGLFYRFQLGCHVLRQPYHAVGITSFKVPWPLTAAAEQAWQMYGFCRFSCVE